MTAPPPRASPPRAPPRAPPLDPFALPADTTFRFALLIALVIAASLATVDRIARRVPSLRDRYLAAAPACLASGGTEGGPSLALPPAMRAASECNAAMNRPFVLLAAGGAAVVLVAAGALYWLAPRWKLRRDHLEPLTAETGGEIHAALVAASREAGLAPPPTFVWNLALAGGTPLAFGRLGRRYVFVPGGLVELFLTAPARFRAVVLHELAHHRNRDVDLTYFAVAVWHAYLALAVLPYALALLASGSDVEGIPMAWRVAALAALVYLARNAVLRSREVYADARAARWLGGPEAVAGALTTIPAPPPRARWLPDRWIPDRWRALAATHPSPDARRRLLDDPAPLFAPGAWEAFAAGLATAVTMPYLVTFFLDADLTRGVALGPFLLAAVVCAPLVVGVLGVGAWRQALVARAAPPAATPRPPTPRRRIGQAEAFPLGALVGTVLPLSAWLELRAFAGRPWWLTALVAFAAWGALLLVTTRALVRWLASGARAWLARDDVLRRPAPACACALATASLVGLVWLALLMAAHPVTGSMSALYTVEPLAVAPLAGAPLALVVPGVSLVGALIVLPPLLLLLAAAALWAYPLASALWPGAAGEVGAHRAALRAAVAPALRAAAAFGVVDLALRAALRLAAHAAPPSDGRVLQVHFAAVAVGLVLQARLARRVARRSDWLPEAQGLFAAFVAAVVMLALYHAINVLAFGGTMDAAFLVQTVWQLVGGGALVALVGLALQRRRAAAHETAAPLAT